MERITIKAYAVKHKLSMFNVMKMVKSGQVKSEVVNEEGREVTYILFDEKSEKEIEEKIVPNDMSMAEKNDVSLAEAVRLLKMEVQALREEVEHLKKRII